MLKLLPRNPTTESYIMRPQASNPGWLERQLPPPGAIWIEDDLAEYRHGVVRHGGRWVPATGDLEHVEDDRYLKAA